jgi:hypothetical protein
VLSILESSGGFAACGHNAWGVGSCSLSYESWEEGIEDVARRLSEPPYAGLELRAQFCIWVSGQPCLTEHGTSYADKAMALMEGF